MKNIKKALNIYGTPIYDIKIGERALIAETDGCTRHTSVVEGLQEVTDTRICFETRNTFYTLFIKTSPLMEGIAI